VSLIGVNDAAAFREAILKQKDALTEQNASAAAPAAIEQKHTLESEASGDLVDLTKSVKNIEKMLETLVKEKGDK
jgi:putative membrane protein